MKNQQTIRAEVEKIIIQSAKEHLGIEIVSGTRSEYVTETADQMLEAINDIFNSCLPKRYDEPTQAPDGSIIDEYKLATNNCIDETKRNFKRRIG